MAPPSITSNGANCTVKIMEECHISPITQPSQALPFTFLDIPWLQFPPIQPLFFFQLPPDPNPNNGIHNTNSYVEFSSTILPSLKHSLSSALEHFFPFAGKCIPHNLVFLTGNGPGLGLGPGPSSDGVGLTVALCDADFTELCSNLPKSTHLFHTFVPCLPIISPSSFSSTAPLMAVQITFFPSLPSGFTIGVASHPVLCDQRTLRNFFYTWAYFSKFGNGNWNGNETTVNYDRSVILDPTGLKPVLLKQWLALESNPINSPPGLVRSTSVMDPSDIANATRWIQDKCNELGRSYPILMSPYVVTCAFLWSCFLRARVMNRCFTKAKTKGPMYFGFIAGGITRLPFKVPVNYFGNCVGFGRAVANREELLKENDGILVAADAIAQTIKKLNNDVLGGADKWVSDWNTIIGSEDHVHVIGSPKVNLYDMDFGWGRPNKIEEISIDVSKGISLTQSSDMKGGIEIGVTLPNLVMDAFSTLFSQGLRAFACPSRFSG